MGGGGFEVAGGGFLERSEESPQSRRERGEIADATLHIVFRFYAVRWVLPMIVTPISNSRRITLEQYLAFEEMSEAKHEFHAGEVIDFEVSPEHALITANAMTALLNALEHSWCHVYASNLKIGVPAADRVCYPDGSVVCSPLQFHPRDKKRHVVTNPRVIVEVLSPTTEAYDRGEKFHDYRTIESFEEYVLISQTEPIIETFVRQADGLWVIAGTYAGLDALASIRCLSAEVKLRDIYDGVEFPPKAPSPDPREREPF
jgi:Uma2 family endonuclease